MLAFKWSWAAPERFGVVPGGSRERNIDFPLVWGARGGGATRTGSARATRPRHPPQKSPKTIENSLFRALEPPGTTPERSGTAQDHLKASISHQESLKTTQSGLQDAESGLQDAMLCARGADLCARRAILCAQGAVLCARGIQKNIEILMEK